MLQERIALRYAKALYEDARTRGALEAVLADQRGILQLLDDSRELRTFLQSPILSNARKREILQKLFHNRLHAVTESFYDFLTLRGREEMIPYIAREFVERYNRAHRVVVVQVVSATALSDAQRSALVAKIGSQTGATVQLEETVRPSVLGGLSVQVGDLRVDNTVSGALLRTRKRLQMTQ